MKLGKDYNMSKMSELHTEIEALLEEGMSAKFIVATLGVPYEWVQTVIEERECLEIEKQYGAMSDREL